MRAATVAVRVPGAAFPPDSVRLDPHTVEAFGFNLHELRRFPGSQRPEDACNFWVIALRPNMRMFL